ncbi:molybdate ABC transporter substrate-binding protein [uncultured Roseovarius sp.]|uniref:molybdate ABC transporter substrate-binding protein n=1 Tax=uncultured Roseovarius sp. TaxID=293344 RepID=UPI002628DF9E|nr:molybdate ABC transporter substrate-binding protein [uncultured Roseovarius sp.]
MKRIFHLLPLISTLLFLPLVATAGQGVTVFAAASLRDALEDVVAAYEGEVVISYGGSGQIARQVAQGAPADVVILANAAWMDWLEINALESVSNRLDLLGSRLVLIGPEGAIPMPEVNADILVERLAGGRLAMGQTQGVPAGIYGRQWLENAGFWSALAGQLAETENVRTALALVARGEAPLGVVYATDARAERGVVTLYEIPDDMHDPVRYPVAVVKDNNDPDIVEFMRFIQSERVLEIFRSHGFIPLVEAR